MARKLIFVNLTKMNKPFLCALWDFIVNILLINENDKTTATLSKFFKEKGFSFYFSKDPMQGLCLIRQNKFDVILLDVSMHVIKGFGIVELLASDNLLKDQNIFIFSEEDIPEIQLKYFLRKDGIKGFLKKPLGTKELSVISY